MGNQSLHIRRGKFLFLSPVIPKEGQMIQGLIFILSSGLIKNDFLGNRIEKDNLKGLRKLKIFIIWRQNLPMKIHGGSQNGIVVQNLFTRHSYVVETNTEK